MIRRLLLTLLLVGSLSLTGVSGCENPLEGWGDCSPAGFYCAPLKACCEGLACTESGAIVSFDSPLK